MKKIITDFAITAAVLLLAFSFGTSIAFADTILTVTGITADKVDAIADNTYENGWKWTFHVTLPENENMVKMKFADFSNGTSSIPVANNVRLFSTQSTNSPNSASAITIVAPNVYSDNIIISTSTDLNLALDGVQTDIVVEMKVPIGTVGNGYTTSYGISSSPQYIAPEDPVVYEENSIASGLCLVMNPDNWSKGGGYISPGSIYKYGQNHNFNGINMLSISSASLSSGLEWLIYLNASTTNGYSSTVYPEWRSPESIANLNLIGKVTYNSIGEIVSMVSENPNCKSVSVTPVEEIQSGLCLVPVDTNNFKVTEGIVLFDGVPRNFPEKILNINKNTIDQDGIYWTAYTNYSSSSDKFNVHFTNSLQDFVTGPNPKEVNVGHITYRDDGTILGLKSKNPSCTSYYSPEGGGIPVPSGSITNTKPVVTLTDPAEITIKAGEGYADFHFTAIDNEDGDLLDNINLDHITWSGVVDIWTPGDYVRTVTATDSGGLISDPVSQLVHVIPLTEYEKAWKDLHSFWAGSTDYITTKIVVGSGSGQYDQSDVDVFTSVLDSTKAILDNPSSTITDLGISFATLTNAFSVFMLSINP